jgi:hypothetical protein
MSDPLDKSFGEKVTGFVRDTKDKAGDTVGDAKGFVQRTLHGESPGESRPHDETDTTDERDSSEQAAAQE